jgi:hypothetical protein
MGDAGPEGVIVDTSNLVYSDTGSKRRGGLLARAVLAAASAFLVVGASAEQGPTVRTDSNLIYVSSSAGDDANDGLSPASPKKTLAGGVSCLRDGYPDWLFLRRGDTWSEGFAPFDFTGRSASEPIVITAYGPGTTMPKVQPADPSTAMPDEPNTVVYGVDVPDVPDDGTTPVLIPGTGWSGPTEQPAAVGNPGDSGYDAKAIAQFDLVPFQDFHGAFGVGVVAFHMSGIDRVEFSVDGGAWESVSTMNHNPRTGSDEYWVTLDSSLFAEDRAVEIRAIAWPVVGEPRVISQTIFADAGEQRAKSTFYVSGSNGSDTGGDGTAASPFASIKKALQTIQGDLDRYDGSEVVIQTAGEYNVDQLPFILYNDHWITVRAAEGLTTEDVIVSANSPTALLRPRAQRLRFQGLGFDFSRMNQVYKEDAFWIWFDECRWFQSEGWTYMPPMSLSPVRNIGAGGLYVTDSVATDMVYGFVNTNLVRGSKVEKISGDAYQNSKFVLNCKAHNIDGSVASHHSDLLQYFGHHENLIVFGLEATQIVETQNFFLDHANSTFNNCAFVSIAVENFQAGAAPFSQLNSTQNHVLFMHISNPGQWFILRDDMEDHRRFVAHNVVFMNSVLERIHASGYFDPIPEGVIIEYCHFVSGTPRGTDTTTGPVVVLPDGTTFRHSGESAYRLLDSAEHIPGLSSRDRGAWSMVHVGD